MADFSERFSALMQVEKDKITSEKYQIQVHDLLLQLNATIDAHCAWLDSLRYQTKRVNQETEILCHMRDVLLNERKKNE